MAELQFSLVYFETEINQMFKNWVLYWAIEFKMFIYIEQLNSNSIKLLNSIAMSPL